MSAERSPQHESSLMAAPLAAATRLVLRHPKGVIAGSLILGALSLLAASQFMGFKTSRLDLLNPKNDFNRRWLAYIDEFGDQDDAVILVEGAGRDAVGPALDELAAALAREPKHFLNVLYRRDLSKLRAKGLHYLPDEELVKLNGLIDQVEPILAGAWDQLSVGRTSDGAAQLLANPAAAPPEVRQAAQFQLIQALAGLGPALADEPVYRSPWANLGAGQERLRELDSDYLLSNEGKFGFVLLNLPVNDGQFAAGTKSVERLREIIKEVQLRHAEVKIGLTGMPILENDEMRASQTDMLQATLISLVGVAILFLAGFGGWRHSVFAVVTLLISMAWSFGFITFAIGHLNILSSAFAVILIGLGIDFGIHYVARYLQLRLTMGDSASALEETATSVGPGIITGGVTTAVAFGTTAMTDFVGVAELGIVAAGGLLLCIAGALLLLPAMIHLSDRKRPGQKVPPTIPFEWVFRPVILFPKTTLVLTMAITLVIGAGAARLRYDHNLLNLQPTRIESVEVEKRLHSESDRSVFFAVSIAGSRQELRERKARFEKLESVDRTEEIASLTPESNASKRKLIGDIQRRLAVLSPDSPTLPKTPVERFNGTLARVEAIVQKSADGSSAELRNVVTQTRAALAKLGPAEAQHRLDEYERRNASGLWEQLRLVASLAEQEPPTLVDVPAPLASRFVGKNKKHLLRVYARGNVWDMHKLEAFVRDVESVDPAVTGHPVQTYYASRQMQRSYVHAALYSMIAVAIVVMLDFRSIRYSLLSLLPMGLGLLLMFGILGLLDIPLNPANMIALPLILGIGIDDGVHLVHDYLQQKGRFRLTSSTATAVLLTSLTTMVGFGVMVFARHQGIRTLGQALTIGVGCCLATSIVMLPALLSLMSWNRREVPPEAASTPPPQTHVSESTEEQFEPPSLELEVGDAPSAATLRTSRILARRRRRAGT